MSDVTLTASGEPANVVRAPLLLNRAGNWTIIAEEIDAPSPPTGQVVVSWQGAELRGYVLRSDFEDGLVSAVILGGAGGLTKQLQPKMYDYQLPARMVAEDIVNEAGERLSPLSAPALLQTLASWVRQAGDGGEQLSALCDALGCIWRVELDGSIFIGTDSYPEVSPDWDHTAPQDGWHAAHGMLEVVPGAIGALPGQRYEREVGGITIAGRIGTAVYTTGRDGPGARLYFVDERAPQSDNAAEPLRAFVRETMRGVELLQTFGGQVALQRADGTLDIYPDDRRLPPLTSVRVRVPVPGAKLRVVPGARCQVVFEGGDVRQPRATLYEPGSATAAVARVGDTVALGTLQVTAGVGGAITAISWVPPGGGTPVVFSAATPGPFPLTGKVSSGSPDLSLP